MPIYEYKCLSCGSKFEYLVRGSSEQIICPHCNKKDLKRLISSFSFTSKDSGGNITASSGCSGCAGANCSSCSR